MRSTTSTICLPDILHSSFFCIWHLTWNLDYYSRNDMHNGELSLKKVLNFIKINAIICALWWRIQAILWREGALQCPAGLAEDADPGAGARGVGRQADVRPGTAQPRAHLRRDPPPEEQVPGACSPATQRRR